nr:SDR family oxidoreductase [Actinoplanes sp. M2I2]
MGGARTVHPRAPCRLPIDPLSRAPGAPPLAGEAPGTATTRSLSDDEVRSSHVRRSCDRGLPGDRRRHGRRLPAGTHEALAGLHPVGRMGEISDVTDAIVYLENAPFVTGEILHVDGGQSAGGQ